MAEMSVRKPPMASIINDLKTAVAEQVRLSGVVRVDSDELAALKAGVKAQVRANAVPPYDPVANAADRELESERSETKARQDALRSRRQVLQARLLDACEQTESMPAPRRSAFPILATGTGVFTLCFAPTAYSIFFAGMDDAVLAWAVSIVIGAAVGGFLCLLLVNSEEEQK